MVLVENFRLVGIEGPPHAEPAPSHTTPAQPEDKMMQFDKFFIHISDVSLPDASGPCLARVRRRLRVGVVVVAVVLGGRAARRRRHSAPASPAAAGHAAAALRCEIRGRYRLLSS